MLAILTLLIIIFLSITITKMAAIALVHTGLSFEAARFQARSAFTGSGFTTVESENVVNHPVRRRIIMLLMLTGNVGIVTAVSTLILTFIHESSSGYTIFKLILILVGIGVLWFIAESKTLNKYISRFIHYILNKFTDLDVRDYASLLLLAKDYRLAEIKVQKEDWIADRTLAETELSKEGLLVLGVKRLDGTYIGAPRGSTLILHEDVIIVYGRVAEIETIDNRRKTKQGDREHIKAIKEQEEILNQESQIDQSGIHPES